MSAQGHEAECAFRHPDRNREVQAKLRKVLEAARTAHLLAEGVVTTTTDNTGGGGWAAPLSPSSAAQAAQLAPLAVSGMHLQPLRLVHAKRVFMQFGDWDRTDLSRVHRDLLTRSAVYKLTQLASAGQGMPERLKFGAGAGGRGQPHDRSLARLLHSRAVGSSHISKHQHSPQTALL